MTLEIWEFFGAERKLSKEMGDGGSENGKKEKKEKQKV